MKRNLLTARLGRCILSGCCIAKDMPEEYKECPWGVSCDDGYFNVGILRKGGDKIAEEKAAGRKA